MPLRESENYIWSTEDQVGQGSLGLVFRGFHKGQGKPIAVKTIPNSGHSAQARIVLNREFDVMRKLKHINIVKLYAFEKESNSDMKVMVMELCDCSLYDIIAQPQHAFGLEEADFLLVLDNIISGLRYLRQHGIVHRDLKPGNILRKTSETGRFVFKLSDFGTARKLNDQDGQFASLCGTEEYLHPDMYEAVFYKGFGGRYGAHVDLWSLGVTLYHTAAGQLPFQPYGGRTNKHVMYQMTAGKPAGVISGIQKTLDGPIEWSKELPRDCLLSEGAKQEVTPVISHLLDKSVLSSWSFEVVFDEVAVILDKHSLCVFSVIHCSMLVVYLDKQSTIANLQESIAEQTQIRAAEQLLFLGSQNLLEVIKPMTPICKYPRVTSEEPIVVIPKDFSSLEIAKPTLLDISRHVASPSATDGDRLQLKKEVALGIRKKRCLEDSILNQKIMAKTLPIIRNLLRLDHQKIHSIFPYVETTCRRYMERISAERELFRIFEHTLDSVEPVKKKSRGHLKTYCIALVGDFSQQHNDAGSLKLRFHELDKGLKRNHECITQNKEESTNDFNHIGCADKDKCLSRATTCVENMCRAFEDSSNKHYHTSSINAKWLYKVVRTRIEEEKAKITSLLQSHCYPNMVNLWQNFLKCLRQHKREKDLIQGLSEEMQHAITVLDEAWRSMKRTEDRFIKSVSSLSTITVHGELDYQCDGLNNSTSKHLIHCDEPVQKLKDIKNSLQSLRFDQNEVHTLIQHNTQLLHRLNDSFVESTPFHPDEGTQSLKGHGIIT